MRCRRRKLNTSNDVGRGKQSFAICATYKCVLLPEREMGNVNA